MKVELVEEDVDIRELESLIYLDEPGLQLYLPTDPDINTLLECFLPKALIELFLNNVNNNLEQVIRKDYPIEG